MLEIKVIIGADDESEKIRKLCKALDDGYRIVELNIARAGAIYIFTYTLTKPQAA